MSTADVVHEVLFVDGPEDLVASTGTALRTALRRGEHVVLACSAAKNHALLEALRDVVPTTSDRDVQPVTLAADDVYTRPAAALQTYRDLVRELWERRARPVCVLGEAAFPDPRESWREWARYEAVFNLAVDGVPMRGTCVYDRTRLPPRVLDDAMLTHPFVRDHATGAAEVNPRYVDPAHLLAELGGPPLLPLQQAPPQLRLEDVHDPLPVRDGVRRLLEPHEIAGALSPGRSNAFLVSVHEVLVNALSHGERPVETRAWSGSTEVVVTVTDSGAGLSDPLAGYVLANDRRLGPGIGLWLARMSCDEVTTMREPDGFTVRLSLLL